MTYFLEMIIILVSALMSPLSSSVGGLQTSQRDTQRMDDLARVIVAANTYQTNNNGKTPWNKGSTDKNFVRRYIDADCSTTDGINYSCGDSVQFADPDGTTYKMRYVGSLNSSASSTFAGGSKLDHTFYVYTYASCGDDEGTVQKGTGERQYAIMYRLESGGIACNDNH